MENRLFGCLQLEDVIKMHNNVNNVGEARHTILDGYTLGFQMLELASTILNLHLFGGTLDDRCLFGVEFLPYGKVNSINVYMRSSSRTLLRLSLGQSNVKLIPFIT